MEQELVVDMEGKVEEVKQNESVKPSDGTTKISFRNKRDIFRFQGEKDLSINLEHVTCMFIEGNKITFQFYNSSSFIDFEDEAAAKNGYEQIIRIWSADVEC